MECERGLVLALCALLILGGALFLFRQLKRGPALYGRYSTPGTHTVNARWAWFLQELPAFLVPTLMASLTDGSAHGRMLLMCTFTLHYFHRSLVYPSLIRGARPVPLLIVVSAAVFCFLNGLLQSHSLLHCSNLDQDQDQDLVWVYSLRTVVGLVLFSVGMILNLHSDHILRNLRKPGETGYKIPQGGLFSLVSGANFLAEIVEWSGFAVIVWNLPGFSFFFFTICSIGPRALGHHRFYQVTFPNYPRDRRALVPLLW